jgi:hypothetical protein
LRVRYHQRTHEDLQRPGDLPRQPLLAINIECVTVVDVRFLPTIDVVLPIIGAFRQDGAQIGGIDHMDDVRWLELSTAVSCKNKDGQQDGNEKQLRMSVQ